MNLLRKMLNNFLPNVVKLALSNFSKTMMEDLKEEDLLNSPRKVPLKKLSNLTEKISWEEILRLKFLEQETATLENNQTDKVIDSRAINPAKSLKVLLLEIYLSLILKISYKNILKDVEKLDQ